MSAVLSPCGTYRYQLRRDLGGPLLVPTASPLVFCMLNPSTADATRDDATIRRCRGFAVREGRPLLVVNLFALRSRHPAALRGHPDPIGPDNDEHLRASALAGGGLVVVAWGAGAFAARTRHVAGMLQDLGAELVCLGMTKDGNPRHPLHVRADQALIPWPPQKPRC